MENLRSDTSTCRGLRIRRVPLDSLRLDPANARLHDDRNRDAIRGSLARFGQQKPIVVDRGGVIVAGNGTFEAARSLGWIEIDVVETGLEGLEAAAFAIADNRTSDLSEFDSPALARLLAELQAEEALEGVGFEDDEVEELLAGLGEIDEPADVDDQGPGVLPETPVSRIGDLWTIGEHRLLCGDSTTPEAYTSLLGGERARMCFSDPPWNVAIGLDGNPRHKQRAGLANDSLSREDFARFLDAFARTVRAHVAGDLYCVLGASEWPTLDRSLRGAGFHWSATIVWVKDLFVLGRSKYHRRYEPIWYGWGTDTKSSFGDRRDLDDVWEIDRPRTSEEHPTMKPIELVTRAIENSSEPHDLVLDPFVGSGTTIVAAEASGRRARGIEIDPHYVDVAVKRWEAATGGQATLGGRTFDQVASERSSDAAQDCP